MAKSAKQMDLSILEAVDNLTVMAELNLEEVKKDPVKILEKLKTQANWLTYRSKKQTDEKIKLTFSTIYHYLQNLSKKIVDPEKKMHFQKGVQAVIGLAQDAIKKVDGLKEILHPGQKITSITNFDEVRNLESFFQDFEKKNKEELALLNDREIPGSLYGKEQNELIKDLSLLKNDSDYELLFIRREDGLPFFSQEMIAHVKYICDFDESFLDLAQENPLKMMKIIQDEEACMVADEIFKKIKIPAENFLKAYKSHKNDTLGNLLYMAIVALAASKNPRNVLKMNKSKSCLEYFRDFHYYLSQITSHQLIDKLDSDPYLKKAKMVIAELSGWFFLHPMNHDKAIEAIKVLINKGQMTPIKRHSIWSWFNESFHNIEEQLKKFPSGPIYKIIQQYENGDFDRGFSSIMQGNIPCSILEFEAKDKKHSLLYLPSPTLQAKISHAEVLSEFKAFLDLNESKSLLLFNLQDKQFAAKARTDSLEKEESLHSNLFVVSIPKDTAFYHQENEYQGMDEASSFLKALYDQVQGAPVTGFHFPKKLKIEKIKQFSQKLIPIIHQSFFAGNKILSRKNRQDFIEVFYGFLLLKIVEMLDPDYVSFTCKDAVDIGSMTTLQFFSFLKFLIDPSFQFTDEDHDHLVQIALVPAFLNRGRTTSFKRMERMLSALVVFEQVDAMNSQSLIKLKDFYPNFSSLKINWI